MRNKSSSILCIDCNCHLMFASLIASRSYNINIIRLGKTHLLNTKHNDSTEHENRTITFRSRIALLQHYYNNKIELQSKSLKLFCPNETYHKKLTFTHKIKQITNSQSFPSNMQINVDQCKLSL